MRTGTLGLLAVVATVLPVAGVAVTRDVSSGAGETFVASAAEPSVTGRALAALREWDSARAHAWAHSDPRALARLYTPTSRTGRHDVADLLRWAGRGLRVVGLHQQIGSVRLTRTSSRILVVVVTDRTVDGVAVGGGRRTAVPASAWATHRVVLERVGPRWCVREVWAQPAR